MRKIKSLLIVLLTLAAVFTAVAFNATATQQELVYTVIEITEDYTTDLAASNSILEPGTNALKLIIKNDITATVYFTARNISSSSFPVVVEGEKKSDGTYPTVTAGRSNVIQPMTDGYLTVRNLNFDIAAANVGPDGTLTQAYDRRGVYVNTNATLVMENVTLTRAYTTGAGGGISIVSGGKVILKNCTISNCYAGASSAGGGAIYCAGNQVELYNTDITGCASAGPGGAINVYTGKLIMDGGTISNNTAGTSASTKYGSGVFVRRGGAEAVLYSGSIINNVGMSGLFLDGTVAGDCRLSISKDSFVIDENYRYDGVTERNLVENNTGVADVTLIVDWKTPEDMAKAHYSFLTDEYTKFTASNSVAAKRVLIRVHNDITTPDKIFFDGKLPVTIEGVNQAASEETPIYPTIKREGESSFNYGFFGVRTGSNLTLRNITLDFNGYTKSGDEITPLYNVGAIYLNAGTADAKTYLTLGAGACIKNGYNAVDGGCIRTGSNSVINIEEGAKILNCISELSGGAISTTGTLNMSGGVIEGCISLTGEGGGIFIGNGGALNMSGGTVSGNKAVNGGGISVKNSSSTISNTTITDNDATVKGGGLYISSVTSTVYLSGNANITNNTLNGTTPSNVQKNSGFGSYDDDVYSTNSNSQIGWLVLKSDFSGKVGIYFEALPVSMDIDRVNYGVVENGADLSNVTNDNGKLTVSQGTDVNGTDCLSLLPVGEKIVFTFKITNGGTQTFTTIDFDKYALPTADNFLVEGYDETDFLGFVKVSGYGTKEVKAEAVLVAGQEFNPEDVENLYATFLKVETIPAAAVAIDRDGLKFITKVEKGVLESIGLNVKGANASGDGYYRGTLLGVVGKEDLTLNGQYGANVTIKGGSWIAPETYKKYAGAALEDNRNAFAATLMYTSANASDNYNKAVAFRGYVAVTIGDDTVAVYSDCKLPEGGLVNGDAVEYSVGVHARSARASIRKSIFSSSVLNGTYNDLSKLLSSYIDKVCSIAGINWDNTYSIWVRSNVSGSETIKNYWNPILENWSGKDPATASLSDYINPVAYQAPVNKTINIAMFGDGVVSAYNMGDILIEFAAQDGYLLNLKTIQYNNAGQVSSGSYYSLFELYENDVPSKDNLLALKVVGNGGTNASAGAKTLWYLMNREPNFYQPKTELDYFLAFSSRDAAMSGNNLTKNKNALLYLQENFADYENTKNTQFVVMAPPKYDSADTANIAYANSKNQTAINNAAKSMANYIDDGLYFAIGDGWTYFTKNYSSSGIDLYDRMQSKIDAPMARYPSMAGAYYNACLIYGMLFGRSPVGMTCYGYLPEAEAKLLQQAAEAYIASTGATLQSHVVGNELEKSLVEVYDATEISSDNGFFKYVLANATAHYSRGNWIQYNQTAMNNYVASVSGQSNIVYRLDAVDGVSNPEASTPQKSVYSDCSRWVSLVYADVFDNSNMRNTYTSCSKFYEYSRSGKSLASAVVKDWTLANVTDFPAAVEELKAAIQPGDLLLYNSTGSGGSHIILYIGNGMVMHCTGDQAGGGGSDYNLNNNSDKRELVGGIRLDHLDIFTEDWSYRYAFDPNANDTVTLIRPANLSEYSTSKLAADAKARVDSLIGSVAYRTSTAPAGVTIPQNGTVTFTYTVENLTPYAKTHEITEVLPTYASYVSSTGGSYNSTNKTLTFNLSLGAYETKSVTCTVKITASNNTIVHFEKASIDGVPLTFAQVEVNGTLTSAQQNTVATYAKNNMANATDVYALAKSAYNGTGITLGSSAATVMNAMFTDYTVDNYKGWHPNQSSYSVFYKAWQVNMSGTYDIIHKQYYSGTGTSGFYGGQCVRRNGGVQHRIKDVYSHNLMAGDLILWVAREDCYAPGLNATSAELSATDSEKKTAANALTFTALGNAGKIQSCMYIGNGEFIVKGIDGSLKIIGGSEARNFCEQLLGEGVWYLYRPSAK